MLGGVQQAATAVSCTATGPHTPRLGDQEHCRVHVGTPALPIIAVLHAIRNHKTLLTNTVHIHSVPSTSVNPLCA